MLFLDTYEVKAAYSAGTSSVTGTVTADSIQWSSSGNISNGTGAISPHASYWNTSGSYHFEVPIILNKKHTDFGNSGSINLTDYYTIWGRIESASITGSANVENMYIKDTDGNVVFKQGNTTQYLPQKTGLVSDFFYADANGRGTNLTYYVCGDAWFTAKDRIPVAIGDYGAILNKSFSISVYWVLNGRLANANEIESSKVQVSDSGANSKLNDIKQSEQNIEESVTSETGNGLLATIKSFFGSFFDNIINSFKSLFIPEDGYFTNWFNRLNTLLADKLGMLYAPFDLVISTLTAIMNADSSETGIPFPGIKWEDTWIVEPFTFTFSSLGNDMSDLRDTVYFATDVVLLFAFLYLLEEKIRHILED